MVRMICQYMNQEEYDGEATIYAHDEVIGLLRDLSGKLLHLLLYHTEDRNLSYRKELYKNEGKKYFKGNICTNPDTQYGVEAGELLDSSSCPVKFIYLLGKAVLWFVHTCCLDDQMVFISNFFESVIACRIAGFYARY